MNAFTSQQLQQAQTQSRHSGESVPQLLQQQAQLSDDQLVAQLAELFHCQPITLPQLRTQTPALDLISYSEAARHQVLVVRNQDSELQLVLADPFNQTLCSWVASRVPHSLDWCLIDAASLQLYLEELEQQIRAVDNALQPGQDEAGENSYVDISLHSISEDSSPVVKLVNSVLYDALKLGASDIHLESLPHGMNIKNRIDGVLTQIGEVNGRAMAEQVISRIKVLAELNIAEHRVPQDGRFKAFLQGHEVDFRVSIMPSILGEDAVLRILDKRALADEAQGLRLDSLGFEPEVMKEIRHLANEPYGMLLMTGPTGSGKTTTLYAMLSEINSGIDKIVTIEDPVEYQLPGILQIPVNEKKGLTFALGLRSILRHDPDKIMVGEIRDPETAQIAVQSALTGHLVFSSVHANNPFDVMNRFMHMKIDPFSFVSALNGVLAQRLVRVNCPHCSEAYMPAPELLTRSGLNSMDIRDYDFQFRRGVGCDHCRDSGYLGRKAIAEILVLTDELRELIIERAPLRQIKDVARANGSRSLRDSAMTLVQAGLTTLEEINRVTFVE